MGGLFVVFAVVLLVDVLTRFFDALWLRIEPRRGEGPPTRVGGAEEI
jgi:hypothetical protein